VNWGILALSVEDNAGCGANGRSDRRYQWVVTLEPLGAVGTDDVPVVPRKVVNRFGVRGFVESDRGCKGVEVRSAVVEAKRSPRLLLRRQLE
jgi:hypothetical protein